MCVQNTCKLPAYQQQLQQQRQQKQLQRQQDNKQSPSTSTFLHEIKSHGSDAYKVGKDKE